MEEDEVRSAAQQLLAQIGQGGPVGAAETPPEDTRAAAAALLRRVAPGPITPARADEVVVPSAPQEQPPLREQFSREYFETAGRAAGGLAGGEGVVDLSGSMPLMREGGVEVSVPEAVRPAAEYLGDVLMTVAGAGGGAYGYLAGGIGDLLVNAGVMDRPQAQRLVRDLMAAPEAFAGTPGQLVTAPRMAAPRAVRAAPEAPEAPSAAIPPRIEEPAVVAAAPEAAPRAPAAPEMEAPRIEAPEAAPAAPGAAVTPDEDARIGELIRRGAGFGIGARRAREELARLSQANPEAAAAAERLGIELPVDVLADQRQIREAIGMTRSIAGSEARTAWLDDLTRITDEADTAIRNLAGATDLSTVSARTLDRLSGTRNDLRSRASEIYDAVDAAVPERTRFQPNNTVRAINTVLENLGGEEGMNAGERRLFKMVTNADQPVTYERLMREKAEIRRALDGDTRENPYGSSSQRALQRMYKALTDDQLANVERVGGTELRDNLVLANQLWRQQGELGTQIVSAFGRDQQGSIANRLRTAVTSAAKGDVAALNRTLELIPEDLRREAVASAIREAASSTQGGVRGFGFSQFTDFYSSLRRNPEAYRLVAKSIGPEADSVMRDIFEISRRVTDARANVISTGRANQPLLAAMRGEGFMSNFLNTTAGRRAMQAGTTGAGGVVGGLPGAMLGDALGDTLARVQPDRLQRASQLFRSDDFKRLVEQVATQEAVPAATVNRVANSREFRRWADAIGIEDPRNWLQGAILAASADQGAEPEAQQ